MYICFQEETGGIGGGAAIRERPGVSGSAYDLILMLSIVYLFQEETGGIGGGAAIRERPGVSGSAYDLILMLSIVYLFQEETGGIGGGAAIRERPGVSGSAYDLIPTPPHAAHHPPSVVSGRDMSPSGARHREA